MAVIIPTDLEDQELDPVDVAEDQAGPSDDDTVPTDDVVVSDLSPELEEEIKRVMVVEEEEPTKSKAQVVPDRLILRIKA